MADPNRNAKVIIPLAIAATLGGALVLREGVPPVFQELFALAFVVAVVAAVFSLMARSGWDTLAARYRATEPYAGPWRAHPHAAMSYVSVEDPTYRSQQTRFIGGTLRVATTAEALHLAMLFARVPLLGRMFPEVRIPWPEVRGARKYEAPGRYAPQVQPGTVFQVAYDPNYTGTFVELAIGEPPVFLQLPAGLLGTDALARLPLAP